MYCEKSTPYPKWTIPSRSCQVPKCSLNWMPPVAPLSPASRLLTTFTAPSGRYCFNKLPFGTSSAPENFQKRMSMGLAGLQGMDDVLVFGGTRAEHATRLLAVLQKIEKAGGDTQCSEVLVSQDLNHPGAYDRPERKPGRLREDLSHLWAGMVLRRRYKVRVQWTGVQFPAELGWLLSCCKPRKELSARIN